MGNPFETLPSYTNPNAQQPSNPFESLPSYTNQPIPDQPNFFQQAFAKVFGAVGSVAGSIWELDKKIFGQTINTVSYLTRPLGAPQQLLYGALSGDPVAGLKAAVNDVTSYVAQPFAQERLQGSELIKQASSSLKLKGVPDLVANIGGFALDIGADPTNWVTFGAGALRKAAVVAGTANDLNKAARFERLANVLDKATAPAKTIFQAIPQATREAAARQLWNIGGREIGGNALLDRQSIAEFIAPNNVVQRFAPAEVSKFIAANQEAQVVIRASGHMTGMRVSALETSMQAVLKDVPTPGKVQFSELLNQFITHENPNDAAQTWFNLEQMANKYGVDTHKLWDVAAKSADVQFFNSAAMSGTNLEINQMMKIRLGIDAQAIQETAAVPLETVRLRSQIPDSATQAGLGVTPSDPYGKMVGIAQTETQKAMGFTPTVDWTEILSGTSVRRGLNRSMNVYGADGAAHIEKLRAENRPASVDMQALESAANQVVPQAGTQIAQTFAGYVGQDFNLLDALAATKNAHNLDVGQTQNFLDEILKQQAFTPSGAETAIYMRNARAAKQGVVPLGSGTGLAGTAKQRLELTDQQLQDLGEVRNVLANAYKDSSAANAQVAFQARVLATKKFLTENGLYITPSEPVLPLNQINEGWAKPGFRVITKQMSDATGGVLEVGATVPDYVAREFQVATSMKGAAGIAVLQNTMNNFQTVKMSNPTTIIQNVVTNMTLASSYAPAPLTMGDLLSGVLKFAKEDHNARYIREASGLGVWSSEMMGLKGEVNAIRAETAGAKPVGLTDRLSATIQDLIGRNMTKPALVPRAGDIATLGQTYLGRNLFTVYKASEDVFRNAAYYALQSKYGMDAATAADHATDIFFDYSARPGMVDTMSKLGVPFQTYPQLASWRVLQTLYDRPNLVRNPINAVENLGKAQNDPKEVSVAPSYVKDQALVRIGVDSKGRGSYVPFAQFLPIGAAAALNDTMQNSSIGIAPLSPMFATIQAIWGGIGFRGKQTYQGLGGISYPDAASNDPAEATRRLLKTLYEFGAYPWAPGTATAERLTRALVANGKTLGQLEKENQLPPNSLKDIATRVGVNGPFLWSEGADPIGNFNPTHSAPSDPGFAALRALGVRNYEVSANVSIPGQAQSQGKGMTRAIIDRANYWKARILQAPPYAREGLKNAMRDEIQQLGFDAQQFYQALNTP
jgi:hypothetical protein